MRGKVSNIFALIFGKKPKKVENNKSESLVEKASSPITIIKGKEKTFVVHTQNDAKNSSFNNRHKKEQRDLIIGFDLGTACTKVVIQDPSLRLAHAIPLSEEEDSLRKYLFPTQVYFSLAKGFSLEKSNQNTLVRHLKLLLMEKSNENILLNDSKNLEISGFEITAAYVALVIRKAREWFMKERDNVYKGFDIIWHLNIGIPVKNYDDIKVREEFEKMAIGAWWLSEQDLPLTQIQTKEMKRLVCDQTLHPGIKRDHINVVPEVAAQVAGYARSPLKEEGLHMLVDIGASTLDTATFILNKSEDSLEDRYVFLVAQIERLGSLELHYHRIEKIVDYISKWIKECKDCFDVLSPPPAFPNGYIPEFKNLGGIDEEFLPKVCRPVRKVVALTKTRKDPNSDKFKKGLPLFLCGGASQNEFYKRMLTQVEKELHKNFIWAGFRLSELPKPENLIAEGLKPMDYHRLSVAYGLSFPFYDIGEIVPPSEVDDVIMPKNEREYEFVSKDQV